MENQTPQVEQIPEPPPTPIRRSPTKSNRIVILVIAVILGIVALLGGKYFFDQQKVKAVSDFVSCSKAGFPIMESYPAQCRTSDGRTFVQQLNDEEKRKLVLPTDPTKNWKTYTNTRYGYTYTFKYPAEWKLSPNGSLLSPDHKIENDYAIRGASIVVSISETKETSIDKEFNKPQGGGTPQNVTTISVDGIKAIRSDMNWEGYATITEFIKDGYLYHISIGTNSANDLKNNISVYDNILSTFKFLDQNKTVDTSNWKTYTNKEYGYTLKYPKEWEIFKSDSTDRDFHIKTPNLERNDLSYGGITKGSEISVSVDDSQKLETLDNMFKYDTFLSQISKNKKQLTIDGKDARQYDIAYEGVNTTNIVVLSKGTLYTLTIHFPLSDAKRQTNLDVYQAVVSTFRLGTQ